MQRVYLLFFFFNDTATTEIYTLSLHDALPIYDDLVPARGRQEEAGAVSRLSLPLAVRAEDDPVEPGRRAGGHELQYRAATADLDVIRMGPQAQHPQRGGAVAREVQRQHQRGRSARRRPRGSPIGTGASTPRGTATGAARFHISHGASPRAYISSRRCLSLNVSMDSQKPS